MNKPVPETKCIEIQIKLLFHLCAYLNALAISKGLLFFLMLIPVATVKLGINRRGYEIGARLASACLGSIKEIYFVALSKATETGRLARRGAKGHSQRSGN